MFQNPSTIWIEILVLVLTACFIASLLGIYLYKKAHHLPTGDCGYCHKNTKKLLKEYHKCCACKK